MKKIFVLPFLLILFGAGCNKIPISSNNEIKNIEVTSAPTITTTTLTTTQKTIKPKVIKNIQVLKTEKQNNQTQAYNTNTSLTIKPPALSTLSPTSVPITVPTPTVPVQPPLPTYSSTFPIILSVTDNFGNTSHHSGYNEMPLVEGVGYCTKEWSCPKLKVGDTLIVTVNASDPKNKPLTYWFGGNLGNGQWTSNNIYTHTITTSDIGGYQQIIITIKNNNSYHMVGSSGSDTYDDNTNLYYTIPPTDLTQ